MLISTKGRGAARVDLDGQTHQQTALAHGCPGLEPRAPLPCGSTGSGPTAMGLPTSSS